MASQSIIKLRQELHTFPELSCDERETSERILKWFSGLSTTAIKRGVGGHGIIIVYDSFKDGPHIGFRCELDALPIVEENEIPYKSVNPGISHKCGHDGHMAILAGVGEWLSNNPLSIGKVSLIFQPAEEIGLGAIEMLNDTQWDDNFDFIFALHNLPGYPLHHILTFNNQLTPTVLSIGINLKGKTSHASEPQNGINPSLAISKIIESVCNYNNPTREDPSFKIITPVHTSIGSKDYGISPGDGETHFTIRTHTQEKMNQFLDKVKETVSEICNDHQLTYSITESDYFPSVTNDVTCINMIKEICSTNDIPFNDLAEPLPFGEDFGYFTRTTKGAMVGLGSGLNTPPLHNPAYDFPDEIISTGIKLFTSIIEKILN